MSMNMVSRYLDRDEMLRRLSRPFTRTCPWREALPRLTWYAEYRRPPASLPPLEARRNYPTPVAQLALLGWRSK